MGRKVGEPPLLVYSPSVWVGRESFSSILSSFPSLSNFSVFFTWARTIYQAMMLSLAQGFPNFDEKVIPSGESC